MPRNDSISRRKLIHDISECRVLPLEDGAYIRRDILLAVINAQPSAESNETVEWIWDGYYDEYACSYCGNLVGRDKHKLIFHNYCPCCGRKVKRENKWQE